MGGRQLLKRILLESRIHPLGYCLTSIVVCLSMKRFFRVLMLCSSLSMVILLPPPLVRASVSSVMSWSSLSQHTHSVSALA